MLRTEEGSVAKALEILRRIEALPLVRRRGQPDHHREPVWHDQTERIWVDKGVYDESGGLLLLAAHAAVTVTRWQLQVAYELAIMGDNTLWAKSWRKFDDMFGVKPRYQLIDVLEAVVREHMDIPTLPFSIYPLIPVWEEVLFNELVLVQEIRRRPYRIMARVRDGSRRSVEIAIEDYSGAKLIEVHTSDTGLGSAHNRHPYEKQHIASIRSILEHLIEKGLLEGGVFTPRLDYLTKSAQPDAPFFEQ
ncbi:MAG: hypothetical protein JWN89_679 [Parcubacteria group bacterium]|nr:hypothetical protein [Parcubacteria group bacterium]